MGLTADMNGYVQSETYLQCTMNVDVNVKLLETNLPSVWKSFDDLKIYFQKGVNNREGGRERVIALTASQTQRSSFTKFSREASEDIDH